MRSMCWIGAVALVAGLTGCPAKQEGRDCRSAESEPPATQPASATSEPTSTAEPIHRVVEIKSTGTASDDEVTSARYETAYRPPWSKKIQERDEAWQEAGNARTEAIRERQEADKKKRRREELVLACSLPPDQVPASLAAFNQVAHRPPVLQYETGTCWSFATTSLLESEVERLAGQEVKLAEMGFVYYEFLAKGRRVLAERGDSLFDGGSEANAVARMAAQHGAWPLAVYPGVTAKDGQHDHLRLQREMDALLESLGGNDMWDEESGLAMLRVLLDRHLGRPPARFEVDGRGLSPEVYLRDVLKIDPSAYVSFVSTLKFPFHTCGEFEVPDNWWHDKSYHNLPLDEFYAAIEHAIDSGYSLVLSVDVTEPGNDIANHTMFVPAYDIPPARIDQLARELRFENGATTDDHWVHLVGHAEHAGHDWFLVKDSSGWTIRGEPKGYGFVRDDYIKLKALAFTVHRDAVADVLASFDTCDNRRPGK